MAQGDGRGGRRALSDKKRRFSNMSKHSDNILLKHIDSAFPDSIAVVRMCESGKTTIDEIREQLLRVENSDLPVYLGAVLRDTLIAQRSQTEESNPLFRILLFLAPPWLDEVDEFVKPLSAAEIADYLSRYSSSSKSQIDVIILWLEHVKGWECCRYDVEHVNKALGFWRGFEGTCCRPKVADHADTVRPSRIKPAEKSQGHRGCI